MNGAGQLASRPSARAALWLRCPALNTTQPALKGGIKGFPSTRKIRSRRGGKKCNFSCSENHVGSVAGVMPPWFQVLRVNDTGCKVKTRALGSIEAETRITSKYAINYAYAVIHPDFNRANFAESCTSQRRVARLPAAKKFEKACGKVKQSSIRTTLKSRWIENVPEPRSADVDTYSIRRGRRCAAQRSAYCESLTEEIEPRASKPNYSTLAPLRGAEKCILQVVAVRKRLGALRVEVQRAYRRQFFQPKRACRRPKNLEKAKEVDGKMDIESSLSSRWNAHQKHGCGTSIRIVFDVQGEWYSPGRRQGTAGELAPLRGASDGCTHAQMSPRELCMSRGATCLPAAKVFGKRLRGVSQNAKRVGGKAKLTGGVVSEEGEWGGTALSEQCGLPWPSEERNEHTKRVGGGMHPEI
ncbi:hypothetical protein C8R46DRAFT_1033735 [Mycena filopes]|nr:hypothetical protein C8R46DRAFT_1033735 [Mycena filopes]